MIEVVVVSFVCVVLAALILPAIRHTQPASRRAECQNNMKQLVTALTNYASRDRGRLPQLYTIYPLLDADDSNPDVPNWIQRSWAVALLPDLDQAAVKRAIDSFDVDGSKTFHRNGHDFDWPSLCVFQCSGSTQKNVKGGLSYVANTGYVDQSFWGKPRLSKRHHALAYEWDGKPGISDFDKLISHSTGTFWKPTVIKNPPNGSDLRGVSLDFIALGDGQSNTILIAENLQAGNWHRADNIWAISFGLKIEQSGPNADVGILPGQPLRLGPLKHAADSLPGANLEAAFGTAPRPSSNHLGTCIYGFADGSAKQISDTIDPFVYANLLSPNGQRHGQIVRDLSY